MKPQTVLERKNICESKEFDLMNDLFNETKDSKGRKRSRSSITVKEFIEKLSTFDENACVSFYHNSDSEYSYCEDFALHFTTVRPETDEELKARVAEMKAAEDRVKANRKRARKTREEAEKALYDKLRKKYETD